jgi:hypothetical protein
MGARELLGLGTVILASAKQTIAAPATTAFDFGTPNDIYLPTVGSSAYQSGMRLLLVCTATTAGTTSTLTWVVQDADDNAGSIGTPATALTDATGSTLAGGTGDDFRCIGVQVQTGRPWLRVAVTHATATDSFVCGVMLLGLPGGL